MTRLEAFGLGAAGGASVLATFVAASVAVSKLLDIYDRAEERMFRDQERAA